MASKLKCHCIDCRGKESVSADDAVTCELCKRAFNSYCDEVEAFIEESCPDAEGETIPTCPRCAEEKKVRKPSASSKAPVVDEEEDELPSDEEEYEDSEDDESEEGDAYGDSEDDDSDAEYEEDVSDDNDKSYKGPPAKKARR